MIINRYGYIQGCNLKKNQSIHLLGVGDFHIASLDRMPDPCPLPEKNIEKKGRRKLNEKEVLLYAPMSNIGKILYDKDAMQERCVFVRCRYINLPSLHFTDEKSDLVQQHTLGDKQTVAISSNEPCMN